MLSSERHQVAAQWAPAVVLEAVGDRCALRTLESVVVSKSFLDTFDWRLHRFGGTLVLEETGGASSLRWHRPGEPDYAVDVAAAPRFAIDLPVGYLRELLAAPLDVRALLPLGRSVVERQDHRALDGDGNIVLRLRHERVRAVDSHGTPDPEAIGVATVWLVPGHEQIFRAVLKTLRKHGLGAMRSTEFEVAVAANGRTPGDYSSKLQVELAQGQPADRAMRLILGHLLEILEANVNGVVHDHDTEFLHDLRVACRRTRSALTQLKGVLPRPAVAPFLGEFKWLGAVTGPCRDLDVYLLEMHELRRLVGPASAARLAPLQKLIEVERQKAWRVVVRALACKRFGRLLRQWREVLEKPSTGGGASADVLVEVVAAARIRKAFKRVLRRGSRLVHDPVAEELHRLRIDAKKLRYLLEFFRSLFDDERVAAMIKELKKVQDVLGGFNDCEVQQARLRGFAGDLAAVPPVPIETLLALGRLEAILEQRQEQYRQAFAGCFLRFSTPARRAEYMQLFVEPEVTR